MFNLTLYRRELKGVWLPFVIMAGVMTMYITVIISLYDPKAQESISQIMALMPGVMEAVGIRADVSGLIGHLSSYLYGMILILFPMVFSILCGNKLVARYVDRGSMVSLLAAPVKRRTVAFTQMTVIATGVLGLVLFATVLEIGVSEISFPGELDIPKLLLLNAGLLCLHWFIAGICFLASCLFSDAKHSVGAGAGVPALMYVLQMLGNVGGGAEKAKYFTFFTLYDYDGLLAGAGSAFAGMSVLLAGAVVLFGCAIAVFSKKDLHI